MRLLTCIIIAVLAWNHASAQTTDYYSGKDSVVGNDYTYRITTDSFNKKIMYYNLENTKNRYLHTKIEDGIIKPSTYLPQHKFVIEEDIVYENVRKVLTKDEIDYLKTNYPEATFVIEFAVDKERNVRELRYAISHKNPYFMTIAPDRFYQLELLLKEIKLTPRFEYGGTETEIANSMSMNIFMKKL